ncbi:MAG: TraB/GumN family protein [Alphaproteobacteria bacterium]|nr:TraB/GumN family protein [Alphaproteobacteria bacterium]MBV9063153.1 TraB/GumN family protein [Alphaproteobacteria bacterium]
MWFASAAFAVVFAGTLRAEPAATAAAIAHSPVQAHPALWVVHGPRSTAYLLGSIHVLPPDMQWHTREIDAALRAADTFVFEIPMDEAQKTKIQEFIKQNGMLPPGVALPSLLTADIRKDYAAALNLTHVNPELLTPMRPWLALLMLETGMVTQQHYSPDLGVDRQVYAYALKQHVTFRALETPEQQLKLLMPEDQSLEMQEFDAGLKELLNETLSVDDLVNAWAKGDTRKLNDLMNSGFKENPKAEKPLFDDRNRAWVAQLEAMLKQRHVYFVTVGAGHLAGPKGVPSLLRRDGYKVDGP